MLYLTRKTGESLLIGSHITVTVISVKGNQVRLGVKAPDEIRIDREEVRWRMNSDAASRD